MSVYTDFIAFVDGGSLVPFHVDGATYFPRPTVYNEMFDYSMKQYYVRHGHYYVGIDCSNFVRQIMPSDYRKMRELFMDSSNASFKKNIQLTFDFS